jgi:MinD-like ATPase involved in chromosome partitioning or flagellar assembly
LAAALFSRLQADVILAELVSGQGALGLELGVPHQKGLTELLRGNVAEVTREKTQASLVSHSSGLQLLLASENPRDIALTSQTQNYEAIVVRLAALAHFIVLDLGTGLPDFTQKILPMCNERIVVVEGAANSIQHSKFLIDEIANLQIDRKDISVTLNNRQRSEAQMPWMQAQEMLGHSVLTTFTPAPELFLQATRMKTPAVICQPANMTSQQFLKLADALLEREKAR